MIAELQAKRKRETDEWPRHDWDFKRKAIIASGMVDERRKERELVVTVTYLVDHAQVP